mmetsp:Transcript_28592/g.43956  ORF Transcript_28592/g.43956 Transcript_28592/m.43956 type:complete len:87 (-) Transcript_28592:1361-1621(-)
MAAVVTTILIVMSPWKPEIHTIMGMVHTAGIVGMVMVITGLLHIFMVMHTMGIMGTLMGILMEEVVNAMLSFEKKWMYEKLRFITR